jgi:peptide subunit release factor 1 (eRF1)
LNEEINGYIIAGSANLKMDFVTNEALSASIKNKIIKVIDVAQGAE